MKSRKFWTIGIGLVGILIVFSGLMEFGYKGVANSETVRIVKAESASPKRIAMLIERSDTAALSGNTYFVFVGDRIYSLPELRRKLYGLPAVFRVGRGDGLSIAWSAPDELSITCQAWGHKRDHRIAKVLPGSSQSSIRGIPVNG